MLLFNCIVSRNFNANTMEGIYDNFLYLVENNKNYASPSEIQKTN